jgi:kynurenine formamidase
MFSLDGYRAIELSPRIKARIHRADGTIEEGNTDPYGKPWVMKEGVFPGDNSLFTLYWSPPGDEVWRQERMTSHNGSHVQGGKGHISHWKGTSPDMKGIWEMPLETFIGEAAVCNLAALSPKAIEDSSEYPVGEGWNMQSKPGDVRGLEILPDHLDNIQKGDIVLMTSPFSGLERPWLSARTTEWLIKDRQIKMLGMGVPGIEWQYDLKVPAPNNSPIRRMLLGANVPIAHPLVNIENIKADRVFYFGLPLNFPKFEASFIRAVAFEAPEGS